MEFSEWVKKFEVLLKESADPAQLCIEKWYEFVSTEVVPDYVAAMQTFIQFVRETQRTSPSTQTTNGLTPLHQAANKGYDIYLARLCQMPGVNVNCVTARTTNRPIHLASSFNHLACLKVLAENGADLNVIGENCATCLFNAASQGHVDIVDYLIKNDKFTDYAQRSNQGQTALQIAIYAGKFDVASMLLEKMANIKGSAGTIVHTAVQSNQIPALDMMAAILPNLILLTNPDGKTPLHLAIELGLPQMVKALIDRGAYPDGQDFRFDHLDVAAQYYFLKPFSRARKDCFDFVFHTWQKQTHPNLRLAPSLNELIPTDSDRQKSADYEIFSKVIMRFVSQENQVTT